MKKTLFILLLISINSYSQKKTNVDVIAIENFNDNSSITIISGGKDPLMIRDLIESEIMFSSLNFKVLSYNMVKKTIELKNNININLSEKNGDTTGSINQSVELDTEGTLKVKSFYGLTFSYTYNPETAGLMQFYGQIVNIETEEVMVKFKRTKGGSFGYGVSKKKVIASLVKNLIEAIN